MDCFLVPQYSKHHSWVLSPRCTNVGHHNHTVSFSAAQIANKKSSSSHTFPSPDCLQRNRRVAFSVILGADPKHSVRLVSKGKEHVVRPPMSRIWKLIFYRQAQEKKVKSFKDEEDTNLRHMPRFAESTFPTSMTSSEGSFSRFFFLMTSKIRMLKSYPPYIYIWTKEVIRVK